MRALVAAALLIPASFWDSFYFTIPRSISETPYSVHHKVIVVPNDFREENIMQVARAFAEKCRDVPVGLLYLAPGADILQHYVSGSPRGFENWRYHVGLGAGPEWPLVSRMARVLVVGGEAVLLIRRDGQVSRIVLGKRDPLRITTDGQEFEILEIFGPLTGLDVKREYTDGGGLVISTCRDCVFAFDVAVRTKGPLSWTPFKEVVRQLARIKVPSRLHIVLRTDAWFAPVSGFPWVYAFDEVVPPLPSREEYDRGGLLSAVVDRKRGEIRYYEYPGGEEREAGSEPLRRR